MTSTKVERLIVRCEEEINARRMGEPTANPEAAFEDLWIALDAQQTPITARQGVEANARQPHADPNRCEHPYLNRVYVGEGDAINVFDCQHCGRQFSFNGRLVSAGIEANEDAEKLQRILAIAGRGQDNDGDNKQGAKSMRAALRQIINLIVPDTPARVSDTQEKENDPRNDPKWVG